MLAVTVYTKNNCVQCKMTKKFLDQKGIEYQEINISQETQYIDQLREKGFRQTPVVMSGELNFSGFRPSELEKIQA
ncbi:glutaredoxin-like protein NrdH [Convivina praedatoris]|uniref:Glutaredoxin-like protein NrdH n=1 Tax=Convivina praedatoris TaxID=2880963 RepID=A0ABN8HAL9_9LACO|nr:glutaredoxin-like protein NrdH [Convivina sp. LMG 32447]CAH1856055.1 Glutaredoxin-like protein NrdH [Convivina sp. LMG 32447]CAH1856290.1 Glutaredoxin-like protein NrdH [Convivina sp. LMG 32447]CAH1857097.1 Glutaredoxin-like protein NrdH [Convivina sp. LMG 32447]